MTNTFLPDRNINNLSVILQPWYTRLTTDLSRLSPSINSHMIEGWRSPDYQDHLVAEGITKVCSARDLHCCTEINGRKASKAFDLGIFDGNGDYVTNGKDPRYLRAGILWRQYAVLPEAPVGMRWGGDFKHAKPDYDHFEIG